MDWKSYLPVIVRYAITSLAAALVAHGFLSADHNAVITDNLDKIVGALIVLATLAYELFKRPSSKALEVAKQVDAKVPASASVVVKTPAGSPDIVVHPK
jgi:hypothetical protein